MTVWYLYVLECKGGKLYTGITPDIEARYAKHAAGKGAIFTRMNKPVRILGVGVLPNKSMAAKAEAFLKRQPREAKLLWVQTHPWNRAEEYGGSAPIISPV